MSERNICTSERKNDIEIKAYTSLVFSSEIDKTAYSEYCSKSKLQLSNVNIVSNPNYEGLVFDS